MRSAISFRLVAMCSLLFVLLTGASRCEKRDTIVDEEGRSGEGGARERGPHCGDVTCAKDEVCCNPSCGICTAPDGVCTQQVCEPGVREDASSPRPGSQPPADEPAGEPAAGDDETGDETGTSPQPEAPCMAEECDGGPARQTDAGAAPSERGPACGPNTCSAGQVCCNESCGICTPPGGLCTQQICDPKPEEQPRPGDPCDLSCQKGQHCEYVQVQCVRAPCPPQATCVDSPTCGGIAGIPCPGAGECVDDPRDSCDPEAGGADCSGLCECNTLGVCVDGEAWNASPTACACEPVSGTSGADEPTTSGEQCGAVTCPAGQECCNASCGICTEPGSACIQVVCN